MANKKDPFDHPFFTDTDNFVKKEQRKQTIIFIVFIILFSIAVVFVRGEIDKAHNITTSYVGKKAVIESDTLTIIDYSSFHKTYKLSNGIDYEMEFVKSKIIK
jgi:hypothetical protein